MRLSLIDWTVLAVYFAFVLGIGVALKRFMRTSTDFFLSGRSIPAWIAGLAFISANLGAQEVIGMGASGAKYGIMTSHFYWIGAIPAMVFVGIFMMPFYYGSRARSVPEYLRMRFDEKTRAVNAVSFLAMTVFSSGASMYALGKLLQLLLGWDFGASILVSAGIVLVYTCLGGLTSAIYNEVLQFFLIVFGFIPLVFLGLKDVGGWSGLSARLSAHATSQGFASGTWTRAWAFTGGAAANPMGVEWFGVAMGLGFVLSFGYWCTDFLLIQRAMAADSMSSARRTPLIAAIPKMFFPFLVILPGMMAISLTRPATLQSLPPTAWEARWVESNPVWQQALEGGQGLIPLEIDEGTGQIRLGADGRPALNYNLAVPMMLFRYFPPGLLGLGLCALMASFMSGMAGNTTAFNTVWTYDIYGSYLKKGASDQHYLWMGRVTTVVGVLLSIGAAYLATRYDNIMDLLQTVFAYVNAPLLATFLLGMFWKRSSGHGAFWGLILGIAAAAAHQAVTGPVGGFMALWHTYPSTMAQNFWSAIFSWTTCFAATVAISLVTRPRPDEELKGLVYALTEKQKDHELVWWKRPASLGWAVLALALALNLVFW